MEVADLWRREWAGTAEYGKVVEGGVTRRIARAMEVLHASTPGARVRVMRAAYHSSAGPGAPAESFMLHSSRRVISSGFNFLEAPSPTQPTKPLEISSMPLESSPELIAETEHYKVTEPDDFEISEPSKWRGSTRGNSIRMPSEESSSTDNASIIDLDPRLGSNLHRKYSYDSESSDVQFRSRSNSRTSPLLDTPVTLSTLKYKSLLNNSNEWNSRRKSYSFEDTSPLTETIVHSNDTLAMDSSTDSGICKSSELVNDHNDDNTYSKYFSKEERKLHGHEESFKDWLNKNRPVSHYRGTKFKTYREHDTVMEEPIENNITLQSSGKVSITLPVTIETDDDNSKGKQGSEDGDRKTKKVEFCKTEVHFTAESGKVKIIATDEKPPPSNDFRKRRSAFVPMDSMMDKPITLFGEKSEFTINKITNSSIHNDSEFGEADENTTATKSILKNKIPKPKPYLLGENMAFGISNDPLKNNLYNNDSVLTAVSLVNKQLETEKHYEEVKSKFQRELDKTVIQNNIYRTNNTSPNNGDSFKREKPVVTNIHISLPSNSTNTVSELKDKFRDFQVSPVQNKPKTRALKESDLTYFGVNNDSSKVHKDKPIVKKLTQKDKRDNVVEDIFQSVRLIQRVSNSVCNSEHDSDEAPDYQNLPINTDYQPIPVPRLRSKYDDKPTQTNEIKVVKPIVEKLSNEARQEMHSTRRTKTRRSEESVASRSISEPPKAFRRNAIVARDNSHIYEDQSLRSRKGINESIKKKTNDVVLNKDRDSSDTDIPIYVNLNAVMEKPSPTIENTKKKLIDDLLRNTPNGTDIIRRKNDSPVSNSFKIKERKENRVSSDKESSLRKKQAVNKDTPRRRTEKTDKSYSSSTEKKKSKGDLITSNGIDINRDQTYTEELLTTHINKQSAPTEIKERRSRSLHRPTNKTVSIDKPGDETLVIGKGSLIHRNTSKSRKQNKSKDMDNSLKGTITSSHKQDTNLNTPNMSIQSKKYEKDPITKSNGHKSKRSEYVINYDDKNGTVSSICKIKAGTGSPKRKKTSKEIYKENNKDNTMKNKTVDKIALLQRGHQGDPNEKNYADRKRKTKLNVQRSCQLL